MAGQAVAFGLYETPSKSSDLELRASPLTAAWAKQGFVIDALVDSVATGLSLAGDL